MVGQDTTETEKYFMKAVVGAVMFMVGLFVFLFQVSTRVPNMDVLSCVPEGNLKWALIGMMVVGAITVWWNLRTGRRSET